MRNSSGLVPGADPATAYLLLDPKNLDRLQHVNESLRSARTLDCNASRRAQAEAIIEGALSVVEKLQLFRLMELHNETVLSPACMFVATFASTEAPPLAFILECEIGAVRQFLYNDLPAVIIPSALYDNRAEPSQKQLSPLVQALLLKRVVSASSKFNRIFPPAAMKTLKPRQNWLEGMGQWLSGAVQNPPRWDGKLSSLDKCTLMAATHRVCRLQQEEHSALGSPGKDALCQQRIRDWEDMQKLAQPLQNLYQEARTGVAVDGREPLFASTTSSSGDRRNFELCFRAGEPEQQQLNFRWSHTEQCTPAVEFNCISSLPLCLALPRGSYSIPQERQTQSAVHHLVGQAKISADQLQRYMLWHWSGTAPGEFEQFVDGIVSAGHLILSHEEVVNELALVAHQQALALSLAIDGDVLMPPELWKGIPNSVQAMNFMLVLRQVVQQQCEIELGFSFCEQEVSVSRLNEDGFSIRFPVDICEVMTVCNNQCEQVVAERAVNSSTKKARKSGQSNVVTTEYSNQTSTKRGILGELQPNMRPVQQPSKKAQEGTQIGGKLENSPVLPAAAGKERSWGRWFKWGVVGSALLSFVG